MEGKKSISITPSFFNYDAKKKKSSSKSEKKKKDMIVNVNGKSVKEMLLQKLKEYKKNKTKKARDEINNPVAIPQSGTYTSDFLEKIKKRKQKTENNIQIENNDVFDVHNVNPETKTHTINTNSLVHTMNSNKNDVDDSQFFPKMNIAPTPMYGILKHTNTPTLREMKNRTMKRREIPKRTVNKNVEIEIERKLSVGINKTRKKVGVFIKNNLTRRNIELEKESRKKENIRDVKKTLKKYNLIKHGTYAPNALLREIYECSHLVGGVTNNNPDNVIHNFHNNDEET